MFLLLFLRFFVVLNLVVEVLLDLDCNPLVFTWCNAILLLYDLEEVVIAEVLVENLPDSVRSIHR